MVISTKEESATVWLFIGEISIKIGLVKKVAVADSYLV